MQKILAESGLCSRRKAEELIAEGRVKVNGHVAAVGQKVDPNRDHIQVDGEKLDLSQRETAVYYMLYKPRGYLTAMSDDRGRKCVAELVEDNGTVKALQGWNAHNATNEAAVAESTSYDGAFVTKSFMGGNAPLVQYTVVKDTPHVYLQEESVAIWNEFFSRYSRGADGTLYYQGNAVTAGKHQPSADWYAAK